ncbi:MAG: LuxR C-terminal-related transcriptional regulator [Microbacterium enclense]
MREGRPWTWSEPLIGADRDAAGLAGSLLAGTSVIVAGTRGSGRSHLLRAVVRELAPHCVAPAVIRPSTVLSEVPFGALDAAGDPRMVDLRRGRSADEGFVVVVDEVHALDVDSALLLARAVADGRVTLLASLLMPRARARRADLDARGVGQTMLSLWLDGLAERIDLSELTSADGEELLAVLPGSSTLDAATCGAILWRADGSRTLLRELVAEAVVAVSAGRDPFAAIRDTSPHSRLSVALKLHTADLAEADQECLAFLNRVPHVEFSVATRFVSAARLEGMITAGLVHSDESPARRLTANEALAREAERQLGTARIEALIDAAGMRMLDDDGEWWCVPLAVSIAERWHRGTAPTHTDTTRSPGLRARVALDAARVANDRGDAAHAAAHAARGLRSQEAPELRLEAAYALATLGTGSAETATIDAIDPEDLDDDGRGRLARLRVVLEDRSLTVPLYAATRGDADTEIEQHLAESARAGETYDWTRAADAADHALALSTERNATHLRARLSAGLAETFRGRWTRARRHFDEVERLLDARQRPIDIGATHRLSALLVMFASHHLAGADGGPVHARLAPERTRAAREHDDVALVIAGVAASIAETNLDRPEHALLEWEAVREKSGRALSGPDADLVELGIAEALASSGRVPHARAVLSRIEIGDGLHVRHARLSVETTVLMAEGRADEARATARAAAELTFGREVPPVRARDLFRLLVLGVLESEERTELRGLLDSADLPLAGDLARRLEAWEAGEVDDISENLRLHAMWTSDGGSDGTRIGRISRLPASSSATASPLRDLTRREREIALLVEQGHTNREIAARLYLSVRTVESHVYQARAKVDAASRSELGRLVAQWENQQSRA